MPRPFKTRRRYGFPLLRGPGSILFEESDGADRDEKIRMAAKGYAYHHDMRLLVTNGSRQGVRGCWIVRQAKPSVVSGDSDDRYSVRARARCSLLGQAHYHRTTRFLEIHGDPGSPELEFDRQMCRNSVTVYESENNVHFRTEFGLESGHFGLFATLLTESDAKPL